MTKRNKKEISLEQHKELLRALKARFEKNMNRHKGLEWSKVQARLEANPVPIAIGSYREAYLILRVALNGNFASSVDILPSIAFSLTVASKEIGVPW